MFDSKQERDGKVRVPVVFTVNGSRTILEGNEEAYIDYSPDKLLYPYVAFRYKNSVLAKVITERLCFKLRLSYYIAAI